MNLQQYKNLTKKKNNKYKNKICEYNGYKFHSLLERDFYCHLEMLQKSGKIVRILRQVPLFLAPGSKLIVDFMVKYDGDLDYIFYDTKGIITPLARTKIKIAEHLYSIEIKIIKKGDF